MKPLLSALYNNDTERYYEGAMTNTRPLSPDELIDVYALTQHICTVHTVRSEETAVVASITPHIDVTLLFDHVQARAKAAHHMVWMRQNSETGFLELVLMEGLPAPTTTRPWLALGLFLATVVSCLAAGALYHGIDVFREPWRIAAGIPFAATIIGILATHELGHYLVGRRWHAPVSLPYFIPLPPPLSFTGTMGAVIVQREPMRNRRILFDVGLAGPLAGLCVAIPLLFYGLSQSVVAPLPPDGYMQEGNSAFYLLAKLIIFGQILPTGNLDVQLSDVAFAAWIGLLVTMFNLLPIGQLDGGHVAYAVLGRYAVYLAYGTIAFCVLLGVFVDNTWLVWGFIATLANPRHPAPYDDVTRIGGWRIALACVSVVILIFLLTPVPLRVVLPTG